MVWHGMVWHGMVWYGMVDKEVQDGSSPRLTPPEPPVPQKRIVDGGLLRRVAVKMPNSSVILDGKGKRYRSVPLRPRKKAQRIP